MKKKPFLIYLVAIFHLLIPTWYAFQIGILYKMNLFDVFKPGAWAPFDPTYVGLLCLWAIAAGIGIWMVSRVGLALMLTHAAWILFTSLALALNNTGLPWYMVLAGAGTATPVLVMPFLLKEIFSPFFNPRLRWWKNPPRFVVKAENEIQAQCLENCSIYDINRNGCYLTGDLAKAYKPGQEVEFTLFHQEKEVKVKGAVVWVNTEQEKTQKPQGMGVRFLKTDAQTSSLIKALVSDLDKAGKVAR